MINHSRHINQTGQGLLACHIATFILGFPGVLGKLTVLAPVALVSGRTVIGSLCFLAFKIIRGERIHFPWAQTLLLGSLLAIHWTAFFTSIKTGTVAIALVTLAIIPVATLIGEAVFFQLPILITDILVTLVTVAGVVVVSEFWNTEAEHNFTISVAYGIIAALSYAGLSLISKKVVRGKSALDVTIQQNLGAAILLLPFGFGDFLAADATDFGIVAVLAVGCTCVGHTLLVYSLKSLRAHTSNLICSLELVYGSFFAYLLLGEIPSIATYIGGGLITAAAVYTSVVRADIPLNIFDDG